jgi:hypothetical protein
VCDVLESSNGEIAALPDELKALCKHVLELTNAELLVAIGAALADRNTLHEQVLGVI